MDRREMLGRVGEALGRRVRRTDAGWDRDSAEWQYERDLDAVLADIDPDAINDRWMLERYRMPPRSKITTELIRRYEKKPD